MDYKKLCFEVQELVKETAAFIREERKSFSEQKNMEVKGQSNFVTSIDKASEERLVAGLSKLLPESGFVAEEGTSTKKGETYNWIIDPIDGTTNFIHGLTPHAISVGLAKGNEMVIGVVMEISHGELFYAWQGSLAYLDGKEIKVSESSEHHQALVATGFPYTNFDRMDNYLKVMIELMKKSRGLRRLGSAAMDLVYVACGRFDAFWEYDLHAWDVAAGAFILQQAGGKVTDFNGGNNFLYGGELIATNNNYYKNFYKVVNSHLGNNTNS